MKILNPGNLLVQEVPNRPPVLALIDFDSAWAGCAESDLARLEIWRGGWATGSGKLIEPMLLSVHLIRSAASSINSCGV